MGQQSDGSWVKSSLRDQVEIMGGGCGESGSISSTAHVIETKNVFKSTLTNWTTATAKKVTFYAFLKE